MATDGSVDAELLAAETGAITSIDDVAANGGFVLWTYVTSGLN